MPAGRSIAAMACAALLVVGLPSVSRSADGWYSDFNIAQRDAARLDRPMLLHFFAEWCAPCKQMDREVFVAPGFVGELNRHVVAVKLDVDHHRAIAQRFGVESVPTDLFLAPDGRVLGEMNGFRAADDYLRRVAAIENQYARLKAYNFARTEKIPLAAVNDDDKGPRLPALESPEPVQTESSNGVHAGPFLKPRKDGTILVGLKGHSPVSLFEIRKWVKGDKRYAWEHQGLTYFMASPAELEKFRDRAEQYAPRLLGCDPVLYFDEQRAVPGSTQYAAFYDESLYLFTNAETRAKFREHPEDYTRRRTVLLIEELESILR